MQWKCNSKINTELTKEEKDVIDSIEKIESEIKDITTKTHDWEELKTKTHDLKVKRHDLICNNEMAILKHDFNVSNKIYSLLKELKGNYRADTYGIYELFMIIEYNLEDLQNLNKVLEVFGVASEEELLNKYNSLSFYKKAEEGALEFDELIDLGYLETEYVVKKLGIEKALSEGIISKKEAKNYRWSC